MPTLPLYTLPADPNASHAVLAPGGYEWWHFIAEDVSVGRRMVASFHDGFPLHPGYMRRYERYLRRPTRRAPPVPAEFPAVQFAFYEGDRALVRLLCLPATRDIASISNGMQMSVGQNQLSLSSTGEITLRLRGAPWQPGGWAPSLLAERTLSAEFTFTPRWNAPIKPKSFGSEAGGAGKQHWTVTRPACDVRGELHLYGGSAGSPIDLQFTGRGYHDHYFGTTPLAQDLRRSIAGVLLDDDATVVFRVEEDSGSQETEGQVIEFRAGKEQILDASEMRLDWPRPMWAMGIPPRVFFGDDTKLSNPRVLHRSPMDVHVLYDVRSRGRARTALCEFAQPDRLLSPMHRAVWNHWLKRANSAESLSSTGAGEGV